MIGAGLAGLTSLKPNPKTHEFQNEDARAYPFHTETL